MTQMTPSRTHHEELEARLRRLSMPLSHGTSTNLNLKPPGGPGGRGLGVRVTEVNLSALWPTQSDSPAPDSIMTMTYDSNHIMGTAAGRAQAAAAFPGHSAAGHRVPGPGLQIIISPGRASVGVIMKNRSSSCQCLQPGIGTGFRQPSMSQPQGPGGEITAAGDG